MEARDASNQRRNPLEARICKVIFPGETNHYGTMFGGRLLELADEAAFIAATRFARRSVVTASVERTDFIAPIRQGDIVEFVARVVSVGRTSLRVRVDISREHPFVGETTLAATSYFNMVAKDADGNATPVPRLEGA
jgi:acyl-CoA hydrolase